jgi:hypothetical protein
VKATFALAEKERFANVQSEADQTVEKDHGRLEIEARIGRSAIPTFWLISILRRGGKVCEGLGWFEPSGALSKR